jgi:peroxidase
MVKLTVILLSTFVVLKLVLGYQDLSTIKDYEPFSKFRNPFQRELDSYFRTSWRQIKPVCSDSDQKGKSGYKKPASKQSIAISYSAKLAYEYSQDLLSREKSNKTPLEVFNGLEVPKQFCPFSVKMVCKGNEKYQSFDGTCNNLKKPLWGSVDTPYKRYAAPGYDDKFSTPRKFSISGELLPNPREISQTLNANNTVNENIWSHLFVIFGQFVTHDMTLVSTSSDDCGNRIDCPCSSTKPECLPIIAPSGETIMNPCVKFTRSTFTFPTLDCNLGYSEQLNQLTSYLDLSVVYGHSKSISDELRLFKGGLLRTSDGVYPDRKYVMKSKDETCSRFFIPNSEPVDEKLRCFKAGEERTTENIALTSVQTLFLREHNRIASKLSEIKPKWGDEKLFFEARRILIAVYQHIIYDQYIRSITGDTSDQLRPQTDGFFTGYDPEVNPSVANEFATAAMRWGHSGVKHDFGRLTKQHNLISNVALPKIIEATEEAYK